MGGRDLSGYQQLRAIYIKVKLIKWSLVVIEPLGFQSSSEVSQTVSVQVYGIGKYTSHYRETPLFIISPSNWMFIPLTKAPLEQLMVITILLQLYRNASELGDSDAMATGYDWLYAGHFSGGGGSHYIYPSLCYKWSLKGK